VRNIKKEFTTDEILFFYECAFFPEDERNNKLKRDDFSMIKHMGDIELCVRGNPSRGDSLILLEAIDRINEIGLPVSIVLQDTARNIIYFDIPENLKKTGCLHPYKGGCGGGNIKNDTLSFKVWMRNDISDKEDLLSTTIHELINSLGLHGDQLSYKNSILYDYQQNQILTKLSPLDVSALKLLYSPYIKIGLTRKEFKEKFADIVPKTEIDEDDYAAFEKHIQEKQYGFEAIQLFQNMAFTSNHIIFEPHILKFRNQPVTGFKDSVYIEQYEEIISNVADTVNAFWDNKNVQAGKNILPNNIYFGSFDFQTMQTIIFPDPNQTLPETNPNMIVTYTSFYQHIVKHLYYDIVEGYIKIEDRSYNNLACRYKAFLQSVLGVMGLDFNNLQAVERGNINSVFNSSEYLTSADREFLTLYFSSVVKTGMLKWKLEEILKKYYPDLELSDNSIKDCYGYLDSIASTKPISDTTVYRIFMEYLLDTGDGTTLYKLKPNPIVYKISDDLEIYKDTLQNIINLFAEVANKTSVNLDTCTDCRPANLVISRSPDGLSFVNITDDGLFFTASFTADSPPKFINYMFVGFFRSDPTVIGNIPLEALRFYYHPALVAGMDKNRVKAIFKKYYDPAPPKNRLIDMLNRLKTEKDR
jgi:hypothetical protein